MQQREGAHVVIGLAANKVDLSTQRKVSTEEGRTFAENNGYIFYETSAKNDTNIKEMFKAIAKEVPKRSPPKSSSSSMGRGVVVDNPDSDKKDCACSLL